MVTTLLANREGFAYYYIRAQDRACGCLSVENNVGPGVDINTEASVQPMRIAYGFTLYALHEIYKITRLVSYDIVRERPDVRRPRSPPTRSIQFKPTSHLPSTAGTLPPTCSPLTMSSECVVAASNTESSIPIVSRVANSVLVNRMDVAAAVSPNACPAAVRYRFSMNLDIIVTEML